MNYDKRDAAKLSASFLDVDYRPEHNVTRLQYTPNREAKGKSRTESEALTKIEDERLRKKAEDRLPPRS